METTIFLEIEGVLTNYNSMKNSSSKDIYKQFGIDTNALFLLKRLVNATNGRIVFSSSLRFEDDFKQLEVALRRMGFIIMGETEFSDYNKPLEIMNYISKHNISNYLILDSEDLELYLDGYDHFIQTPVDDGIQEYLVDDAIGMVKNFQKKKKLTRKRVNVRSK